MLQNHEIQIEVNGINEENQVDQEPEVKLLQAQLALRIPPKCWNWQVVGLHRSHSQVESQMELR